MNGPAAAETDSPGAAPDCRLRKQPGAAFDGSLGTQSDGPYLLPVVESSCFSGWAGLWLAQMELRNQVELEPRCRGSHWLSSCRRLQVMALMRRPRRLARQWLAVLVGKTVHIKGGARTAESNHQPWKL